MQNNTIENISVVAGGAGFIGSNLVIKLLQNRRKVVVIDNFSLGCIDNLPSDKIYSGDLHVINTDLSNDEECQSAFFKAAKIGRVNEVWHLAANSNIPAGVEDSSIDIKDTFLTTSSILRCMRRFNIRTIYFASSSAIYGDHGSTPLFEEIGPVLPISNYGAMKLASEALISASCESFVDRAFLFRFPNVVGAPATHGVILDFIRKLKDDPNALAVLGDGSQKKAYLHVSDLVDAMLYVSNLDIHDRVFPINIGPIDDGVYVSWIADQVVARVSPNAQVEFGKTNRGWVGDVPKFSYSVEKLINLGWKPRINSDHSVLQAIEEIASQEGFL